MSELQQSSRGQWSGRLAFIFAATGSAVGLGNIWKFPYITGENGGGAFVLLYILCIAAIGIPVMIAEVMLGKRGKQSPIQTMETLAREEGASSLWRVIGWMGVLTGFVILSYYSVIAGWVFSYVADAVTGTFSGITAQASSDHFNALISSWPKLLMWHTLVMMVTMYLVSRGVREGLEKTVMILMPALFILLTLMVGYAMKNGAFQEGLNYLFNPDFSKLTGESVLTAMGHAFFTLSLGMGAIMVYGSYMPEKISVINATITIAIADTVVALFAGMAIFPIIFANGLEPGSGPGLIFTTLPIAFGGMPYGSFFASVFFMLLAFAALTSAISIIEPAVAWLVERASISRRRATAILGGLTWLLGLGTVFSFNKWAEIKAGGKTFFDWMDYLTTNISLPLGGILIAIFAGWVMSKQSSQDELKSDGFIYKLWLFLIRFVAIPGIVIVLLNGIGALDWLG